MKGTCYIFTVLRNFVCENVAGSFSESPEADVADAADVIDLQLIDHVLEALIEHRHFVAFERDIDRGAV